MLLRLSITSINNINTRTLQLFMFFYILQRFESQNIAINELSGYGSYKHKNSIIFFPSLQM